MRTIPSSAATHVKVNDHLETERLRPAHSVGEVVKLITLAVWSVLLVDAPVREWNSYMVEACCLDLLEVIVGVEGVPVGREPGACVADVLSEGVLVDHTVVSSVVK